MKSFPLKLSKKETEAYINSFFQCESFSPEEVKKIKRVAMKFNIKLGKFRKKFCKKCLHKLKGKTRISKTYKIIICNACEYKNEFKLS